MFVKNIIGGDIAAGAITHRVRFTSTVVNNINNIDKNVLSIKRQLMALISKESYLINTMDLAATSTINKELQDNTAKKIKSLAITFIFSK
jgi:membrane peptidoglycan carboxypeptidase